MFTVDLLKGQGLPAKSRPAGVVISAVAVAVPLVIAMVMLGFYLRNRIIISVYNREIAGWEAKIGKLSDLVKLQESFEKEKTVYSGCLAEVKSSIGRFTQWSPVVATVVKNMPESVVLTNLEVKQRSMKKKIPKKDDPKKTTDIEIPVRTLCVSVCASPQADSDQMVRDFSARLRSSDFLGPRLENITVSQESGTLDGRDVISYQIDLVFKPGL